MIRTLLVTLVGLGVSGCFNFDAAYATYCDSGQCGGGGGGGTGGGGTGGGTGGGGTGGGVGGGVGGGTGGGTTDGGTDGGTPDAGCQSYLCPVDVVQLPRVSWRSSYWTVAPGVIAESLDRYQVWTSYDIVQFGTDDYDFYEYLKYDGGLAETDRSLDFGPGYEAIVSKGTLADRWTGTRGYIRHYVDDISSGGFSECTKADGGVNNPSWYGLEVFSPTDVLFVGSPFTICRWTPATGLVELVDADTLPSGMYFYDAHRTASGAEYVVGGEYASNVANSAIFDTRGIAVSAPNDVDENTQNGWNEIDGVGNDAWVVSGSGMIAQLRPDGGFEAVFDAGFPLRSVDAYAANDVWAVGSVASKAVHFDGGSWGLVTLPSSAVGSAVVWERVRVTDDGAGLVLTGYVRNGSPANLKGIVHTYRRFGK
jgi:hypothetical protein